MQRVLVRGCSCCCALILDLTFGVHPSIVCIVCVAGSQKGCPGHSSRDGTVPNAPISVISPDPGGRRLGIFGCVACEPHDTCTSVEPVDIFFFAGGSHVDKSRSRFCVSVASIYDGHAGRGGGLGASR